MVLWPYNALQWNFSRSIRCVYSRLQRVVSVSVPLDVPFKEILPYKSLTATINLTTVDPLWLMVQGVPL
jgi:hypothetical protein